MPMTIQVAYPTTSTYLKVWWAILPLEIQGFGDACFWVADSKDRKSCTNAKGQGSTKAVMAIICNIDHMEIFKGGGVLMYTVIQYEMVDASL